MVPEVRRSVRGHRSAALLHHVQTSGAGYIVGIGVWDDVCACRPNLVGYHCTRRGSGSVRNRSISGMRAQ